MPPLVEDDVWGVVDGDLDAIRWVARTGDLNPDEF